jgi:hypothetical protein
MPQYHSLRPWETYPSEYESASRTNSYNEDAPPSPPRAFSANSLPSPVANGQSDHFAHDPGYVAYREELRCLIFNTAQTAPPSPSAQLTSENPLSPTTLDEAERAAKRQTVQLLSQGRHMEYLKNYVREVAPWVSPAVNLSLVTSWTPYN